MASLLEYLAGAGDEIGLVAAPGSGRLTGAVREHCARVYEYRPGSRSFNFREHRRAIREFRPHVIHSWNRSSTVYAILASIGRGVPVVTSEITNARPAGLFSGEYWVTRFNFGMARVVLSNSFAGLRAKRAPGGKSRVIHNGFRMERLDAVDPGKYANVLVSDGSLRVGMAARFTREKDFPTVLQTAVLAREAGAGISFYLAGDGPELERIQVEKERLKLGNVTLLGRIEDVDNFWRHVDVGILATDPRFHQEGIPNSMLECMAHGAPVVVTGGPAVPELVRDGHNGFVIPPRNERCLFERLCLFAKCGNLRMRLGRHAAQTIRERFEIGKMGREFDRVYAEVTGSRGGVGDVLITLKDLDAPGEPGGVGHYYRALRKQLGGRTRFFSIGKRHNSRGRIDDIPQGFLDWARFWWILGDHSIKAVVVNPSLSRNCLLRDGVFLLLARARRKKTIVFIRGWSDGVAAAIDGRWRWLFRAVFGRADGFIVLGSDFRRKIRDWGYRGPVWLETTTVDDRLLRGAPERTGREHGPVILFLARVEKDKGVFEAIEVCRTLQARFSDATLRIAGNGTALKEAREYVERERIAGVEFAGYLEGESKAAAFRNADIYLFPSSHGEGMPNSVLEAMAFGLPVITTPVGGLREFFDDGTMGFLVPVPDPVLIAERLERLLVNAEEREAIGRANAEYARRHFLASGVARRIDRIWDTVLATGNEEENENLNSAWYSRKFEQPGRKELQARMIGSEGHLP